MRRLLLLMGLVGFSVLPAAAGPNIDHVFVIVMENTSEDTLQMSTNTPYIHGLISAWSSASDYHGVTHPSTETLASPWPSPSASR